MLSDMLLGYLRAIEYTDLGKDKYEKLKHCPVSVAYPLSVFFCNLFNNLIASIPDSLLNESKQLMKEAQDLRNLNSQKS